MVTQPVVFGYTPPTSSTPKKVEKAAPQANRHINEDIKAVTQAIKDSAASSSNNKTAYVAGALASAVIIALGYQVYSQGVEINNLKNAPFDHFPPTCLNSGGATLSPDFNNKPTNMTWTLDPKQCFDILTYGDPDIRPQDLYTPVMLTNHLSERFSNMGIAIGDRYFRHAENTSRLAALILHNCANTLKGIENTLVASNEEGPIPPYVDFGEDVVRDAISSALKAGNTQMWDYLMESLKHKGVEYENLPIAESFFRTEPQQGGRRTVTVTVNLDPDVGNPSPGAFFKDVTLQQHIAHSPFTMNTIKAKLIQILDRRTNQDVNDLKRDVLNIVLTYYSVNPEMLEEILKDAVISKKIDSYPGLRGQIHRTIQESQLGTPSSDKLLV